jgi:phosphoglycolate phosphatase
MDRYPKQPMSSLRPALVFDLDGTLVDTAPDLAAAMNAVLAEAGRPALAPEAVRNLVGRGARALIERGFSVTGAPAAPDKLNDYLQSFLAHYRANIASSRPYPGVPETLALLQREAALGICTSKPQEFAEMLLAKLDLARFFGVVHGAGRTPYVKPDPKHLTDVIVELGGSAKRSVMVGDSGTDVELARAGGIPVILVSYGYTPIPARELGADAVTDDFREIPRLARRFFSR